MIHISDIQFSDKIINLTRILDLPMLLSMERPPKILATDRLSLHPWSLSMIQDFFELTQDEGFNQFLISKYRQESLAGAEVWIRESMALQEQRGLSKWAIVENKTQNLIGLGGLSPWKFKDEDLFDITYRLRESAWGKGYGTEAAVAICDYGFKKLRLNEITATITPDNRPSQKILNKLGFIYDQRILLKGVDTDLYRLSQATNNRLLI